MLSSIVIADEMHSCVLKMDLAMESFYRRRSSLRGKHNLHENIVHFLQNMVRLHIGDPILSLPTAVRRDLDRLHGYERHLATPP